MNTSKLNTLENDNSISIEKKGDKVFQQRIKSARAYHEILLSDKSFKEIYAENLSMALFTFPKFKRNYSKGYQKIRNSYAKFSKSKQIIINY